MPVKNLIFSGYPGHRVSIWLRTESDLIIDYSDETDRNTIPPKLQISDSCPHLHECVYKNI